jgi:hypothetical protein
MADDGEPERIFQQAISLLRAQEILKERKIPTSYADTIVLTANLIGANEVQLHVRLPCRRMMYKYVVKNVARKHGMTATFMPKPLFEDNASGMHVHQSIWKGKTNLFHGTEYAELSELGRFYIGGLLKHDVIETWLDYKRDKEIDAIRLRPHPYEFHLYYDI